MVDGWWFNEPFINQLKVSDVTVGQSNTECLKLMKGLKVDDVVAIHGEGVFETKDLQAGDVETTPVIVDAKKEFWLGVVTEPMQHVTKRAGETVHGKDLEYDDVYICIQWFDLCDDEYHLINSWDCIWESESLMPVAKLGRYKSGKVTKAAVGRATPSSWI